MSEEEARWADAMLDLEEALEWCVIALAASERGERLKAEGKGAASGGSDG